nr:hypothetical protein [uncultured Aminipila sp.]
MNLLFFLLAFACLIGLVVGLIKPVLAIKWVPEEEKTRRSVLKYYGIGLILFFILFIVSIDSSDGEKTTLDKPEITAEQTMTEDEKAAVDLDVKIADLGDVESITLDNSADVQAVRNNYEELTLAQKILVTKLSILTEMEKKVADLQAAENQAVLESQAATSAQAAAEVQDKVETAEQSQSNEYTVYITETGSKYHRDGCRYLKQSQISISKSNAINQGYTPCSICNP